MGIFSSKDDKSTQPAPAPASADPARPVGKTTATPSRREAEAARRQRLNPTLSPKEARRKARADASVTRQRELATQDATPGKVLMRDYVDSRYSPLEWTLPFMMGLLLFTLVVDQTSPIFPYMAYLTWAILALLMIDLAIMWRAFKKLAAERIPSEPLKGLFNYGMNRSMMFRRFRIPRPRVKRGDKI